MQEFITKAKLGQEVNLRWMIRNLSRKPWPGKPLLKNFSEDHDKVSTIEIEAVLQPGQDYELVYRLAIPKDFTEKFFTLNLRLIDPVKKKHFGDALIQVIELYPPDYDLFDQSIILNDQ